MPNALDILRVAAAELGVKESPPGSNQVKYNTAYYNRPVSGPAYPWCCVFAWWVFREAGAGKLFYSGQKTASCTTLYNYYHKQGQSVPAEQAQSGDLVFFDLDGNRDVMNHVGICESCEGGYVTTIDGNTGTANEANGGAVMRRKRELKYVGGVARPAYREEAKPMNETIYTTLADVPAWGRPAVERAMRTPTKADPAKMVIQGDQYGKLHITQEYLQVVVTLDKLGLFGV